MRRYSLSLFFLLSWFLIFCLVQMIHLYWGDWEVQVRDALLARIRTSFPDSWKRSADLYGIFPHESQDFSLKSSIPFLSEKPVLLISGLDDPGYVWQELAPILVTHGYSVFVFVYPNDQSIEASTELLYKSLCAAPEKTPVRLICHSMGGLLARNLLTRPDLDYSGGVQAGILPRIRTLIMVATPHRGSHLARFRICLEARDQFHQWKHKNVSWLNFLMDGTGSAGVQVLPHSSFLSRLNQHSLPPQVNPWIIAGRIVPFSGGFWDCMGDGLVSLNSAQGINAPMIQVSGSHMGVLRGFSKNSSTLPSAIPIILKLLAQE